MVLDLSPSHPFLFELLGQGCLMGPSLLQSSLEGCRVGPPTLRVHGGPSIAFGLKTRDVEAQSLMLAEQLAQAFVLARIRGLPPRQGCAQLVAFAGGFIEGSLLFERFAL